MSSFALNSMPASVTSVPFSRTERTVNPFIGPIMLIRIRPGADLSSNVPSSAMRAGCMPIIISPGSIGIGISISAGRQRRGDRRDRRTMRPLAVDGFAPTR